MNLCKFCRVHNVTAPNVICADCMRRFVRCINCGYPNDEYQEILRGPDAAWPGMPAGCYGCGNRKHVNKKVKAVGVVQTSFDEVSPTSSFIRKRIS